MSTLDRRREIIRLLDKSDDDQSARYCLADNLFDLGLSMYSENNVINSVLYNAYNISQLADSISLHPDQTKALEAIHNHDGVVISAPTSFGKTFCIFEYIVREKPKLVVLVVPTLALAKEYLMVFSKIYYKKFSDYKVHINIDESIPYDFDNYNVFILTHERAVNTTSSNLLPRIDLLVVDEVYKLDVSENDERSLIFNIAYAKLAKKAKKYILLAPFIGGINKIESLEKHPYFFKSSFSPVVNDVISVPVQIDTKNDRFRVCFEKYMESCLGVKTMIYIPNPGEIETYIRNNLMMLSNVKLNSDEKEFLKWAEDEFGQEWSICLALRKGCVVNHGKMPSGVRDYLLSLFNASDSGRNCVICTSTLLEGVNTSTKNLIIVKASKNSISRNSKTFRAFDFFNLVGRTGRLNKYYIGTTYYLKGPEDKEYSFEDAEVTITFEVTEKTKDVDIQLNSECSDQEVLDELASCGLTLDDFINKIGAPMRFSTFKRIKDKFFEKKNELLQASTNLNLFQIMNSIVSQSHEPTQYGIIKKIVDSRHRKTRDVVSEISEFASVKNYTIDQKISLVLNIKNNYLEHSFLNRCRLIKLICDKNNDLKDLSTKIQDVFIRPIEEMYYINSTYKKMLKNIGVYDSDIDKICNVIGTDYDNINELKDRLKKYKTRYFSQVSFISKFSINSIID